MNSLIRQRGSQGTLNMGNDIQRGRRQVWIGAVVGCVSVEQLYCPGVFEERFVCLVYCTERVNLVYVQECFQSFEVQECRRFLKTVKEEKTGSKVINLF